MALGRRHLGVLAALLLAAAIAFAATAAGASRTHRIKDGNDTKGPIDIRSATFTKLKHHRIRFVVTFFQKVPAKGEQGNEFVDMWKTKPHTMPNCNGCFRETPYSIQGPQTGKRPVFQGGEEGGGINRTGTGRIKREGKRLIYTLPLKAIGSPKRRFFWRIQSASYDERFCPGGDVTQCSDTAPNGSHVVRQKL